MEPGRRSQHQTGERETTTGSCYACKSSNNPGIWNEIGLEEYSKMPFAELGKQIDHTIGCANCHEAGTMRLIVTNPAVINGFEAQGIDWTTFNQAGDANRCLC